MECFVKYYYKSSCNSLHAISWEGKKYTKLSMHECMTSYIYGDCDFRSRDFR